MEIGPILRAMTRNKLGVMLIALQIAFTMTVIINAVFIINERSRLMARPSGLDEANLFFLSSTGFGDDFSEAITVADDLAMLRQTPGIINASVINAVPLTSSGSGTALRLVALQKGEKVVGGQGAAEQVALNLIAVMGPQEGELLLRLYPLGEHPHIQRLRHPDDRFDDRPLPGVRR